MTGASLAPNVDFKDRADFGLGMLKSGILFSPLGLTLWGEETNVYANIGLDGIRLRVDQRKLEIESDRIWLGKGLEINAVMRTHPSVWFQDQAGVQRLQLGIPEAGGIVARRADGTVAWRFPEVRRGKEQK